ncbi:Proteasome component (PCI) domain [Dillenia turbinata]|uniref:Proteasome component (PCI) domain n=1 Tax=Dillenia turbinata TaxID=194707 RepID=A0AAN8VLS8_9MAGN
MLRDHVIAASRALGRGAFEKAFEVIKSLDAWKFLGYRDEVLEMLRTKIKEESLRTYLFTYTASYNSLSMEQLTNMFELSESRIHSILSKMMINRSSMPAGTSQPNVNERAAEARIGGGGLETVGLRRRGGQDFASGTAAVGNKWQEGWSFSQGREGSGGGRSLYGGRSLPPSQVGRAGQTRGAGGYSKQLPVYWVSGKE